MAIQLINRIHHIPFPLVATTFTPHSFTVRLRHWIQFSDHCATFSIVLTLIPTTALDLLECWLFLTFKAIQFLIRVHLTFTLLMKTYLLSITTHNCAWTNVIMWTYHWGILEAVKNFWTCGTVYLCTAIDVHKGREIGSFTNGLYFEMEVVWFDSEWDTKALLRFERDCGIQLFNWSMTCYPSYRVKIKIPFLVWSKGKLSLFDFTIFCRKMRMNIIPHSHRTNNKVFPEWN